MHYMNVNCTKLIVILQDITSGEHCKLTGGILFIILI